MINSMPEDDEIAPFDKCRLLKCVRYVNKTIPLPTQTNSSVINGRQKESYYLLQ